MNSDPFELTSEEDVEISIAAFRVQDQSVLALACEHLTWKVHDCLQEIQRLRTQIDAAVSLIDDCAEVRTGADRLPQLIRETLAQSPQSEAGE